MRICRGVSFRRLHSGVLAAMLAVPLLSAPVLAAPMAGMGESAAAEAPAAEGNVPADVESVVGALLRGAGAGGGMPDRQALLPLLQFVRSGVNPAEVKPIKREQGAGIFMRAVLHVPLQKVLRYCFDPAIPGEAVYPGVLRRGFWLPESDILTRKTELWNTLAELKDNDAPVVLRGAEFEEITPDSFSGCYYNYTLDRLLILLRVDGKGMLVSVTRQRAPSEVGRVGAVVGQDSDWNYVYSPAVGSTLKLAGWAKTYMYDSAAVSVLFESSSGARTTELAFFKYVNAGWSGMNIVKPTHIVSGSKRYLETMRQVLESPRLPGAETIAEQNRNLLSMDETRLREALAPYGAGLAARTRSGALSSSRFKDMLLAQGGYAGQLSPPEIRSELIKQYMQKQLGKPVISTAPGGSAP